jgi:hypothetical protein
MPTRPGVLVDVNELSRLFRGRFLTMANRRMVTTRRSFIKSRTWLGAPGAFEDGTLCYRDIGKMIELAIYPSVRRRRAEGHDPERSQQPGKCQHTCFFHEFDLPIGLPPPQYARQVGSKSDLLFGRQHCGPLAPAWTCYLSRAGMARFPAR